MKKLLLSIISTSLCICAFGQSYDATRAGYGFMSLIILGVFFLIGVFLTRRIFKIEKIYTQLRYQSFELTVIRKILASQAIKNGMQEDEISKIIDEAKVLTKWD